MISGTTKLIGHIGFPTESFKSPMIYNPYFEREGSTRSSCPWAARSPITVLLKLFFRLSNALGTTLHHAPQGDDPLAGGRGLAHRRHRRGLQCRAPARDGRFEGDLFDGEGFVRGMRRKGRVIEGTHALVVGAGGVGSAIAASLARAGVARITLIDSHPVAARQLAERLKRNYPALEVEVARERSAGCDMVVNATPSACARAIRFPWRCERVAPRPSWGRW